MPGRRYPDVETVTEVAPAAGIVLADASPDDRRWREFAAAHASSPLQSAAWLDVITGAYRLKAKVALALGPAGEVLAALPMIRGVLPGRRVWTALPFTDVCEPIAVHESHRLALLEELTARNPGDKLVVHARAERPGWHSREVGTTQVLDLSGGLDAVLAGAQAKHRRSVARASRADSGLTAALIEDRGRFLGECLDLTVRSRRRLGTPTQPRRYWQRIWSLHERGDAITVGVWRGEEIASVGTFLLCGDRAVNKYSASDVATRSLKTNFLMYAHAFEVLAARGIRTLDFGVSDLRNEGLRSFKAHWGGQELPVYYSATDERLLPDSLETGHMVAEAIRRCPVSLVRALGTVAYPLAA